MSRYLMALDQGTTSSRAILFDETLRPAASAQKEFTQIYPQAGWVEHDPEEIWQSVRFVMEEVLRSSGVRAEEIAAIGITNQRETTVVWDRESGKPIANAIVWQCRRTAEICDRLLKEGLGPYITETTGLVTDAYFSGTKIRWLLDHTEGAQERAEKGELCFGTVDSWLIWKLTGGRVHATDRTNASRTMLYDIRRCRWDEKLLKALNIPAAMLPEVRPSASLFGEAELAGCRIPIAGVAGDQQAALFGQCCFEAGEAKNTYGTGCFLLMHTGQEAVRSSHGLVTTMAASVSGTPEYALEGSVFVGGAVMQWLRDELRLIRDASEAETLSRSVPDTGGVYLVPAFTGLGAPYWDMYARGTIVGLTRGTKAAHIVRAAEESIAYQTAGLLTAMEQDIGRKIPSLKVDGGACRDSFLLQFQADVMRCEVLRPVCRETTALGAASLAGLSVGLRKDPEELRTLYRADCRFTPRMDEAQSRVLLQGWQKAIGRSLSWAEP